MKLHGIVSGNKRSMEVMLLKCGSQIKFIFSLLFFTSRGKDVIVYKNTEDEFFRE